MGRPPTIKDIAARARVSFKTVSRVLNEELYVREELRARVLKAANDLDYRPNLAARGLIGAASRLIGFIYNDPNHSFVAEAESGALRACRAADYHLAIDRVGAGPDTVRQVEQIFASLRLDGVFLTAPLCDDVDVLRAVERIGANCVRVTTDVSLPAPGPCLYIDDVEAAMAVTDHLLGLGHESLGFVAGHPDYTASARRQAGVRRALDAHGVGRVRYCEEPGFFSFESGYAAGRAMLARPDRPTAIFGANDKTALGVMAAAQDLGLKIPRDVSVAGFDDTLASRQRWPQLTTVRQPAAEMCADAVEMLVSAAEHGEMVAKTKKYDFELMVRGSTGPAPVQSG